MELLIGFLLFDLVVYLLLRTFAKPRQKNVPGQEHERSLAARFAPTYRHPPGFRISGRGMHLRPHNWPRMPIRHRPRPRHW